jgi:hypothetical protein
MTMHDFQPWDNRDHEEYIAHAPMKASEAFRAGDPVVLDADGFLRIAIDGATGPAFGGIALAPVAFKTGGTGASTGTSVTLNPKTGAAYTTSDLIPYMQARLGSRWICPNLSTGATNNMTAGTVLAYATAKALVGEIAGLQKGTPLATDTWQVDLSETADTGEVFRIAGFLDVNKRNINVSLQDAAYVIVQVLQSQWTPQTDAATDQSPPA